MFVYTRASFPSFHSPLTLVVVYVQHNSAPSPTSVSWYLMANRSASPQITRPRRTRRPPSLLILKELPRVPDFPNTPSTHSHPAPSSRGNSRPRSASTPTVVVRPPSPAAIPSCSVCNTSNRRKKSTTCSSCNRTSHLSCVGLSRAQALALPLWHCSSCLHSTDSPISDISGTLADSPPADLASSLAKLRSRCRILARIPKGVRHLVAEALSNRIRTALSEATPSAWWNLLSFAHTVLLSPGRAVVGKRSQTLSSLIRERLQAPVNPIDLDKLPPRHVVSHGPSSDDALARRIKAKCADGDIRSALRLLTSNDSVAPPSEEVISVLRAKHPPPPADSSLDSFAPGQETVGLVASEKDVHSAVFSMPPGSSSGLDGLRPAHLRDLLSRGTAEAGQHLLAALTTLVNTALSGSLPECCLPSFYGATLCALRKKDGGIRPIAVGSVFRRLAARIGAKHLTNNLKAELRPVQLGVGTPQGCEAAVHAVREYVMERSADPSSSHVLVKVDMKNAFNSIRRDQVLSQLRIRCPVLHPMAWQAYGKPSPLYIGDDIILSSSGVQ